MQKESLSPRHPYCSYKSDTIHDNQSDRMYRKPRHQIYQMTALIVREADEMIHRRLNNHVPSRRVEDRRLGHDLLWVAS